MKYRYLRNKEDFMELVDYLQSIPTRISECGLVPDESLGFDDLVNLLCADHIKLWKEQCKAEDEDRLDEWSETLNIFNYQPFEVEPKAYPAICLWHFEKDFDCFGGKSEVMVFDIIPLEDMENYRKETE